MKNQSFPRLYQVNYSIEEGGYHYVNVFVRFIDAVDFLKFVSKKYSYFFGSIFAFQRIPDSIGCLNTEDDCLFQIFKYDGVYSK